MLTLFTQPSILQSIGYHRITKLLFGFTDDLRAAKLPALLVEHQNGNYVDHLAAFLADPSRLPERLRNTLLTLENAASETNQEALESIIQRRLGGATLTGLPLDRALEVWFSAPEELSQFEPPNPNLNHNLNLNPQPAPSQIQNPTSEISSPERGFSTRSNVEPAIPPDADNTTKEQSASLAQIEIQKSKIENASVENPPTPITEADNDSSREAAGSAPSLIETQELIAKLRKLKNF